MNKIDRHRSHFWDRFTPPEIAGAAILCTALISVSVTHKAGIKRMLHSPHQTAFVIRNFDKPWLYKESQRASAAAHALVNDTFGVGSHIDDAGDAVRHAFASAYLKVNVMRDHGLTQARAAKLVHNAGVAHELDGADNPHALSRIMDLANNGVGVELVGDGRLPAAGADSWLDAAQIRDRVLSTLRTGGLQRIGDNNTLIPTSVKDILHA